MQIKLAKMNLASKLENELTCSDSKNLSGASVQYIVTIWPSKFAHPHGISANLRDSREKEIRWKFLRYFPIFSFVPMIL